MIRKFLTLISLGCVLLLCSCKSLDRTVDISLTENYVTGSFVRPTTPDKMKVYVANEPLPLTTEVIGKFSATDPVARRNASLDVLLDTVKKEACRFGANGLFLTDHYKPHWLGSPQHVMHGYILLQPDTMLKPNREHPLNTAIREYQEREEAKRLAEKAELRTLCPAHNFHIGAAYSYIGYGEKAVVSDMERQLTRGWGIQGIYEYAPRVMPDVSFGVLYNGYFSDAAVEHGGAAYEASMNNCIVSSVVSFKAASKRSAVKCSVGLGYQWESISLKSALASFAHEKLSGGRTVLYYAAEYEYLIQKHWGVVGKLYYFEWGVPREDSYNNSTPVDILQGGISLGLNYHF